jgi:hypothetical protein
MRFKEDRPFATREGCLCFIQLIQQPPAMKRPEKITIGEMRSSGVTGVLIYCADHKCSHVVAASAEEWPDDVRLSSQMSKAATYVLSVVITAPISGRIGDPKNE